MIQSLFGLYGTRGLWIKVADGELVISSLSMG